MSRKLLTDVLDERGKYYAHQWLSPDVLAPNTGKPRFGPCVVLRDMENLAYKDEFEVVLAAMNQHMGSKSWAGFEKPPTAPCISSRVASSGRMSRR